MMIQYINEVIVPYVDHNRDDLGLDCDNPVVASDFDHLKRKLTQGVTQVLEDSNIHSVLIPATYSYWRTLSHGYLCQ